MEIENTAPISVSARYKSISRYGTEQSAFITYICHAPAHRYPAACHYFLFCRSYQVNDINACSSPIDFPSESSFRPGLLLCSFVLPGRDVRAKLRAGLPPYQHINLGMSHIPTRRFEYKLGNGRSKEKRLVLESPGNKCENLKISVCSINNFFQLKGSFYFDRPKRFFSQ